MNNSIPFPPSAQVVAYLRDSGGNEQDLSVPQQENVIRAWCLDHGLILSQIFRDLRAPGSNVVGRRAFQEMISWLTQKPRPDAAGVILWKYSRFARDIDDSQFYKALLRRDGYVINSLQDSVPDGIDGRFFEAAIDWMNNRFLEDLSVDVRRGLRHLVEQYGCLPGTPPRGFKREPVAIGRRRDGSPHIANRWVPDPALWPACRLAWELRAQGKSYRAINEITGLFGSLNSYPTFFSNRLYLGELVYGDLVIPNYCEPLIDQSIWDAVQAHVEKFRHNNPMITDSPNHIRRANSNFLLSGLVYCARCGSPMNGHVIDSKRDGRRDEYYKCSRRNRRHDCDAQHIPRQALEALVLSILRDQILDPAGIDARQAEVELTASQQDETALQELSAAKNNLAEVRRKVENIAGVIADRGRDAPRALLEQLTTLERQETGLVTQIGEIERRITPQATPGIDSIQAAAAQIRAALGAENENRLREIFRSQLEKVIADRDAKVVRVMVRFYHPPPSFEGFRMPGALCLHGVALRRNTFIVTATATLIRRKPIKLNS
jgi:site-specific DNA recombinase